MSVRHDEIENCEADRRRAGGLQTGKHGFAGFNGLRLLAELMHQGFEEPPLDGIVGSDQDFGGHAASHGRRQCPLGSTVRD